jgi:DNA-directed RNA polymerase specialized sigma24 family protein
MVQDQQGSLEAFRKLYANLAPDLWRHVRFLNGIRS